MELLLRKLENIAHTSLDRNCSDFVNGLINFQRPSTQYTATKAYSENEIRNKLNQTKRKKNETPKKINDKPMIKQIEHNHNRNRNDMVRISNSVELNENQIEVNGYTYTIAAEIEIEIEIESV